MPASLSLCPSLLALFLMTSISAFLPTCWPCRCLTSLLLMLFSSIPLKSPLSCHALDLLMPATSSLLKFSVWSTPLLFTFYLLTSLLLVFQLQQIFSPLSIPIICLMFHFPCYLFRFQSLYLKHFCVSPQPSCKSIFHCPSLLKP